MRVKSRRPTSTVTDPTPFTDGPEFGTTPRSVTNSEFSTGHTNWFDSGTSPRRFPGESTDSTPHRVGPEGVGSR